MRTGQAGRKGMKATMLAGMELRRLQYFETLAHELHFGRAADRLHITQSALSQQIRVLEREIGATLIIRSSRGVSLSSAGEVLLAGAPALIRQAQLLEEATRAAAQGTSGVLRLAYTRSAADLGTHAIVRTFRSRFPDIKVIAQTCWTARNLELLSSGEIDVAFVRPPITAHGITCLTLGAGELIVALPAGHPLCAYPQLHREQLRGEPAVLWPREQGPGSHDRITSQVWPDGAPIVHEEPEGEHILAAVAEGVGITILDRQRAEKLQPPGVELRSFVPPVPTLDVGVAWRADDSSAVLKQFLACCREHRSATS
jgi:DNA-binding transcriptional LysR family regulator